MTYASPSRSAWTSTLEAMRDPADRRFGAHPLSRGLPVAPLARDGDVATLSAAFQTGRPVLRSASHWGPSNTTNVILRLVFNLPVVFLRNFQK